MRMRYFTVCGFVRFILLCGIIVAALQALSPGLLLARESSGPFKVAVTQLHIAAETQGRPLNLSVWYPSESRTEEILFASSTLFEGFRAMYKGEVEPGRFPLLLLSHGLGGNMYSQAWLAAALAEQGFIVAAPNHPGTMTGDMASEQTPRLWERPRDISRAISSLLADPFLAPHIAAGHIAVAGYSMGGYAALSLGGVHFDPERFTADCSGHMAFADCRWYQTNMPALSAGGAKPVLVDPLAAPLSQLQESWPLLLQDTRVKALVLLEPAFARGFTPSSLAGLEIPVLIIGAGNSGLEDAVSPTALLSGYLAEQLPQDRLTYHLIPDAGHFSFLPKCLPQGKERTGLNSSSATGTVGAELAGVCADGSGNNGRSRALIHAEVIQQVSEFLSIVFGQPGM